MSLHPHAPEAVPEETARVAHAAFPQGNLYVRIREAFETIYHDEDFSTLFPERGRPAESPWRLALVSVFQFVEALSDRQAADAVRGRIDWKFALSLELTDPGFDHTVLSEFRSRLVQGAAATLLLDLLVPVLQERGLLKTRGRQRTDSTHILAAVRATNRFELVSETMRATLNALATVAPDWLRDHAQPEWVERYERRPEDQRLPSQKAKRQAQADLIGANGSLLLRALYAADAPAWLREVPMVQVLQHVWVQNFVPTESGEVRWRTTEDGLPPAALFISSPYDTEAHYASKRTTRWVGYKVHLTETCEDTEAAPHLITHVETTSGPIADGEVTPRIHAALQRQTLLPAIHLVDTGFLDADLLVASQREYGVDLLGPTRRDYRWQARAAAGFGSDQFLIDWDTQTATCPLGRASIECVPHRDVRGNAALTFRFATADCGPCPARAQCTHSKLKYPRRAVTVRPHEQYLALQERRQQEGTAAGAQEYAHRAGIEGTLAQGVRALEMRRSRYIGLARTHLGHVLTAVAINLLRLDDWLAGVPRARTRITRFARLMAQPLTA